VFTERTSVGLDVHARSVVAAAIDGVTGELIQSRLTPSHEHVRSWLAGLPGSVAVAYEAGPTGFGLARSLAAAGIRCEVVAPSKLQRPSGDRVKTDARDAVHLARLLRLDEYTAVSVPTVDQENARDLVRAREDARGDLMRARHRLSKLLLRQGIVYSGGQAWTGAHDAWLRRQRFDAPALQMTFECDYEAVLTVKARRDRLDEAIAAIAADSEFTPIVRRLSCLRGVSTLTALALAVEIGRLAPVHRQHHQLLRRAGSGGVLLGRLTGPGLGHQDRQHPRAPAAGRGGLAPSDPLCGRQDPARPLGTGITCCPRAR
jgi:transposase